VVGSGVDCGALVGLDWPGAEVMTFEELVGNAGALVGALATGELS